MRRQLEALIASTAPGQRLPTVRQLMADLGVGPGTVRAAVADLVRAGQVVTVPGDGTFVASPPARSVGDWSWHTVALGPHDYHGDVLEPLRSVPPPGTIDLASGYPHPSLHAQGLLGQAAARAGRRERAWGRIDPSGLPELCSLFGRALTPTGEHQVVIAPGGQNALWTCLRSLARPGDGILVESPTYVGALAAIRAAGLTPVPVPSDDQGVRTDVLSEMLGSTPSRLAYLQPRAANPTAADLSPDRRAHLLELADRHGLILVEDDWLHDLHVPGDLPPLAAHDPDGHVVHVRSLTKAAAPSLRVAGVAAKGAIAHRLRRARAAEDFFVPGILQEIALDLLTAPGWPRHLSRLRTEVAARRATVSELVRQRLPAATVTSSARSLHLWLRLPDHVDDLAVEREGRRQGVAVVAGTPWFPADPPGSYLRLSCVAAGLDELETGVSRLAGILRDGFGMRP